MDANRGNRKARPANSVRRTRTPEGTLRPAEMRRASDRRRQASHPTYGARHEMTFGTSATARGNLGCPAAREAVAQGPQPHTQQAQVCRESRHAQAWMRSAGSVDPHTYESQAPPAFSSSTKGNWQPPDLLHQMLRRRNARHGSVSSQGTEGQERSRGHRLRTRSNSEGRNPMDVVRMKQAWQVRKARREEGPGTWQQA